eukprot:6465835-Amphidinium_carterae.1
MLAVLCMFLFRRVKDLRSILYGRHALLFEWGCRTLTPRRPLGRCWVAGQVELEHVLPDEEKVKLINLHSMFLSSQEFNDRVKEEGRARAYIDPGLQEKSSKYEALIQELYQRKLVSCFWASLLESSWYLCRMEKEWQATTYH